MAAKLPEGMIATHTIRDMGIGQRGYIGSNAMSVDRKGECYLNGSHPVFSDFRGLMGVERRADGFHVWFKESYWWKAEEILGTAGEIPVAEVHVVESGYKLLDGIRTYTNDKEWDKDVFAKRY